MSEVEVRPKRTNANTHPGQVVINSKQKRRSAAEIAAANEEKTRRVTEVASKAQEDRQAEVARIAQLEDALQREDVSYRKALIASGKGTPQSHVTAKASYREAETGGEDTSAPLDTPFMIVPR
jgi:hypothetical protein